MSVFGIALTAVTPFAALALAQLAKRLGAGAEGSRKLAHILLSNWILLANAVYGGSWAICALPAAFIPLNYLSYRKKLFSAIERRGEADTPGTVWYAVSLFALCVFATAAKSPQTAACGMLAMGYGDGLGALVGKRFGKMKFPPPYSQKSVEGALTVALFSGIAVAAVTRSVHTALICAIPAAVAELFSPRGTDNLTLPLTVGAIVFAAAKFPNAPPVFGCLAVCLVILVAAYCARALTLGGVASATALGVALFVFGGRLGFAALVLFFISGSAVSRFGKKRKEAAHALHERRGARSAAQVAANGLPSLIFAAIYFFTQSGACLFAVTACFAAACADTFSSEIGMLSRKNRPVSILTLKPIERGLSGGVTLLGFAGAALGASATAALAFAEFGVLPALAIAVIGVIGSAIDSAFGAAFQAKYRADDGGLTEQKNGAPVSGISRINNDAVNFASLVLSGVIAAIIYQFLR